MYDFLVVPARRNLVLSGGQVDVEESVRHGLPGIGAVDLHRRNDHRTDHIGAVDEESRRGRLEGRQRVLD